MDYIPNTDAELEHMMSTIGVGSFEALICDVPSSLRAASYDIPAGLTELEVLDLCGALAAQNRPAYEQISFLGAGCYQHVIPTVVDTIASRGEWLTPYTPYQAEASQGLLQATYEFQTMVCGLLQMDVANASLYDGASSVAEAAVLALRATERPRVIVSEAVHPHAREVLATYLSGADAILQEIPMVGGVTDLESLSKALREDVACVILQQPNVFGCLEPMGQAMELAHRVGALGVASVYPISLGVVQPPGAYGADIAVAEGRCLGSPSAFGGPGLGLFATKKELVRRVPGRLVGCTVDRVNRRAFTLTLQTREQHIRRERATSNICTNEGWLALRATLFLSLLGAEGMRELAQRNLEHAQYAFSRLREIPWITPMFHQPFFNEFTLTMASSHDPERVNRELIKAGIVGGMPLKDWYPTLPQASVWCVTERTGREAIDRLISVLKDRG